MGVTLKDRWLALKDALGPRRYMIGALFAAVIALLDWILAKFADAGLSSYIPLPSWAIGVAALILFVAWCLLDRLAQVEQRIRGARVELSKLRTEGVSIRNEGIQGVVSEATLAKWERAALDWNQRAIRCIAKIDAGCAEWFSVLDVVPAARITLPVPYDGQHQKVYNEHDLRVRRLGELIQEMWER